MDKESLSHSAWNCKHHVVFAPEYRRRAICGQLKQDIGKTLRLPCQRKETETIEAECRADHARMLIKMPPGYSVSSIMGCLKGRSSLMIFERRADLKYKYGNRRFRRRGCYADTAGKNAKKIEEYVRSQLQEDIAADQISMKERIDPFTGEPAGKKK